MNETLLLVDDEARILRTLQRVFDEESYTLLTAQTPADALKLLKTTKIDLILCDYLMPGTLGTEVLKYAKSEQPDAVRILVTGSADLNVAIDAINNGRIYYFFTKPWDNDEVLRVVRDALEKKRQKEEKAGMLNLLSTGKGLAEMSSRLESLGSLIETRARGTSTRPVTKVPVFDDDTIILIDVCDINYLAAVDTQVAVMAGNEAYMSGDTLNAWEDRLGTESFFRCHRGYIVNIGRVERITPWFNGAYNIQLEGIPDTIPVSRNHAKELKSLFGI